MRLNENTVICGDKVILVPYKPEHVLTYHEWMKSPELQEATASEPLSLEEEMDMQKKWQLDEDSEQQLTFILLARPESTPDSPSLLQPAEIKAYPMVGDVNLFLPNGPKEDVECEIMIAETNHRRRGIAHEALMLFLTYVIRELHISPSQLMARIGAKNAASISLFERLGFKQAKYVAVWDEIEMRWDDAGRGPDVWSASRLEHRIGTYQ